MVERGKTGKEKDRVIGWLEGSSATKDEDKQVAVPEVGRKNGDRRGRSGLLDSPYLDGKSKAPR